LLILNETIWENILVTIEQYKPILIVLDSIQTTVSSELTSSSGTVSQIREVTYELMNYSKGKGVTSFVIGHVTKEGQLAGPKVLEHMVDSVIYFEGDQNNHYRILRAIKIDLAIQMK
jgi:DNA repair protein RadA/Sms